MRLMVALVAVAFATVLAPAAEPEPRRAPMLVQVEPHGDEPELGDEDDGAEVEPDTPDQQDEFDREFGLPAPEHRGGAPRPSRPPSMPSLPGEEEEEAPLPPDHEPATTGPAEPAGALRPLGQE